ncbi:hypothetical protein Nepgr_023030 [Nepenthes gracilis]|uniref:Uncharacterized protein n=1 Tax=Nepenthes gracilis TaxID=150966 RepID=A0AAD3T1C0_NEPGR|nr:hypothetical protein Nepgr_023030 [Nepenthes gracilis]
MLEVQSPSLLRGENCQPLSAVVKIAFCWISLVVLLALAKPGVDLHSISFMFDVGCQDAAGCTWRSEVVCSWLEAALDAYLVCPGTCFRCVKSLAGILRSTFGHELELWMLIVSEFLVKSDSCCGCCVSNSPIGAVPTEPGPSGGQLTVAPISTEGISPYSVDGDALPTHHHSSDDAGGGDCNSPNGADLDSQSTPGQPVPPRPDPTNPELPSLAP